MKAKKLFWMTALVLIAAFLLAVMVSLYAPGPSLKGMYCAGKPAGTQLWADVVCR